MNWSSSQLVHIKEPQGRSGVMAALVVMALVAFGAIAVPGTTAQAGPAASATNWAAWYESGQDQSLVGTAYRTPSNLRSVDADAHDLVISATSNYPNTSNQKESIANLANRDSSAKWYAGTGNAPTANSPIYAIYALSQPATVTSYEIASANDAPERDPKSWEVLGSNSERAAVDAADESWTVLDDQDDEKFSDRKQTKDYAVDEPAAFKYYQLRVTANRADAGDDKNSKFQIANWTLLGSSSIEDAGVGVAVQDVGQLDTPHGDVAVRYDGRSLTNGTASATAVLHDELGIVVGSDTMLTYQLRPDDAVSANTAIDLVYTDADGSNEQLMSADLDRVDIQGRPITAGGHGSSLREQEWNLIGVDLGDLAGKTVSKVLLAVDTPMIDADTRVSGAVDNITISTAAIDSASTSWQFSDTNSDPASGNADRTVWTQPGFDDSSWKTGEGGFGAASDGEIGGGNSIDTELAHYINGSSRPVIPAYFFRTSFTLDEAQIESMGGIYGSIVYDDSATIYLNGARVTGWDDEMITENLSYQNKNGKKDPLKEFFSIPGSMLQEGENTLAVEIHQCNDTSSDVYFHLPTLVATPDYLPFAFSDADLNREFSSDIRPKGPQGQDYIVAMLDGFGDLLSDNPEILAPNSELANSDEVVAANDLKAIEVNNNASDQQRARALTDGHGAPYLTMADSLGPLEPLYTEAMRNGELPKTAALLSGRIEENIGDHEPAKSAYGYKRPYVRLSFDSDGGRIVKVDNDGSYHGLANNGSFPSGHTNHGYSQGTTLATLVPQLAPQILTRASEYGDNRLVLAFHYPLDVMSSRMVGQRVAQQRWSDPEFRAVLEQAKAETQTVLANKCGTSTVDECLTQEGQNANDRANSLNEDLALYTERLSYGFDRVADAGQPMIVPDGAADLLLSTFPELTVTQREVVLEMTAVDSGFVLDKSVDDEASWQRINLAAAMAAEVTVKSDGTVTVNGQTMERPAIQVTDMVTVNSAVTVTGTGFTPHETVTVELANKSKDITADDQGSFEANIEAPSTADEYTVTAIGADSQVQARADITVSAASVDPVEAIPADVNFNDKDGVEDDSFTVPASEGVEYLQNGDVIAPGTYPGSEKVIITARALDGYEIPTGVTASWSHTFSAETGAGSDLPGPDEPGVDHPGEEEGDETGPVTDVPVTDGQGGDQSGGDLPRTGADLTLVALALMTLAFGAVLVRFHSRITTK